MATRPRARNTRSQQPARGGTGSPLRLVGRALATVCLAAAVLLFFPAWENPFVLDDVAKIEANPDMRLPFGFRHFFYPYSENSGNSATTPRDP